MTDMATKEDLQREHKEVFKTLFSYSAPSIALLVALFAFIVNFIVGSKIEGVEKNLSALEKRVELLDKRFDGVEKRMDAVDKRFDKLDDTLAKINKRFDALDQRLDDKSHKASK